MTTRLSHHRSDTRRIRRRKPFPVSPHVSPHNGREVRRSWRRPTFAEFLDQVEREFGSVPDLGNLPLTGMTRSERLGPGELRDLCAQLGLPPEDFGLDG